MLTNLYIILQSVHNIGCLKKILGVSQKKKYGAANKQYFKNGALNSTHSISRHEKYNFYQVMCEVSCVKSQAYRSEVMNARGMMGQKELGMIKCLCLNLSFYHPNPG